MQVLLKTMEHGLLFFIVIFRVFLLYFMCWDPGDEGIVLYLLPKRLRPYFGQKIWDNSFTIWSPTQEK